VPFSHVEELRLRKVTRNGGVARVVGLLSEPCRGRHLDWKDRLRENTERMREGSLLAVAEVLHSLVILQTQKVLTLREKMMLDRARHMLIVEVSTSRGVSAVEGAEMLEKALAKAKLHLPEPL